ncbi:hypothetical protein [Marinifilum sp. N1E240]|nr:hypothetical protein [Marinifilum sp. N1E240]
MIELPFQGEDIDDGYPKVLPLAELNQTFSLNVEILFKHDL